MLGVTSSHNVIVVLRSMIMCSMQPIQTLRHASPFAAQALFRKIAAALPGMESVSASKQEDMVNVQLTPSTVTLSANPPQQQASTCAC